MKTTKEQRETYRQIVTTHAGALTLDEGVVLALLDDADEADAMRTVLHSIATLDEHDTDDLVEALTNWDPADVYATLRAAINSARMALDGAARCAEEVGRG